ncbi:hypothetical protein TUM12131_50390 (plasmid) [Klebsiella pneumoniae]|nr:hypothetical protein TUM12131_50390 [Klebsiella pneumoniae]
MNKTKGCLIANFATVPQAYLGQEDRLASRADQLEEFVHYVKGEITKVVGK